MLSSMRGSKNQTVVWIILGLLILGLIGFGGAGLGSGTIRSIGKVGDQQISVNAYASAMQNTMGNLAQQLGRNPTREELEQFGLQQNVLRGLLSGAAIDNEAKRVGISVGDAAVAAQIRAVPAFQGIDGTFDKEAYDYALERANMSVRENETSMRETAARGILEQAVAGGIEADQTFARTLLSFARETRSFSWTSIDSSALAEDAPVPDDALIQAYYDANKDSYFSLETKDVTFAWLTPEMLASEITVSEDDLRDSYDLQTDRFNRPESRIAERLVFASVADAESARNRIDGGQTTYDLIAADRQLTPEDLAIGEVFKTDLPAELAEFLFAPETPGIYGPVETSLGPALIRLQGIMPATVTTFENARAELDAEFRAEEATKLIADLVGEVDDLLAAGATLEELANDTLLELGQIDLTAETIDGIAAYAEFRDKANATETGDFPEIDNLSDGGIFALRVNELRDPAQQPLDTVRENVVADWEAAEILKRLEDQAAAVKSMLENGARLTSLGLEVNTETDITRDTFIRGLPFGTVLDMFELENGAITTVPDGDRVILAQLTQITEYDIDNGENAVLLDQVNQQLSAQIAQNVLNHFATQLQTDAGVELNQNAINQINAQFSQ